MDAMGASGGDKPLLGNKRAKPLCPLYTVTFFSAVAFTVAKMPALSLRFQELAATEGWEPASIAAGFGRMAALRSLLEFLATPVLATWSDRVGRRRVMLVICLSLCAECALLAYAHSLALMVVAHVFFGLLNDSNGTLEGSCIADATPPGSDRVIAFGKLFSVVGAAIVVGPALGGELASRDTKTPLVVGGLLACCSLAYMFTCLPEYLPEEKRKKGKDSKGSSMFRDFARLLANAPGLPWYILASALGQVAVGAYGAIQAIWTREALGWEGRDLGRFLSLSGLTMMLAQSVVLPRLLKAMHGREQVLSQLCLAIQAFRLGAYGLAPCSTTVYIAALVTAPGHCHNPVLRSLCSRSAGADNQGLLSGGTSAVGTAAQVLGSLMGSSVLAASLRYGLPLSLPLLLSAGSFVLAAACVARGKHAEAMAKAVDPEHALGSVMGG